MKVLIAIIALSLSSLAAAQVTCNPGYYDAGAASCKKCPLGTFQSDKGGAGCKPCPDGHVSMVEGAIECVPCGTNEEPSKFKDSCKCVSGAAPDSQGNCNICKPGRYMFTRANGEQFCRRCSVVEFQPEAGQTSCMRCPEDHVPNENRTACVDYKCPEGEIRLNGACGTCPPGHYVAIDSCASCGGFHYCEKCFGGTFRATEGVEFDCDPCPRNSFSMRGATKCVTCPAGVAPINKDGTCGTCPAGTFYDQDHFRCTMCKEGTFQSSENIRTSCLQCSGDKNAPKGAKTCSKCASGEVLMKDGTCGVCPPGTGYYKYNLECEKCRVNEYRRGNSADIECLRCPKFSYSLPGASECTIKCPAGQAMIVKNNERKCEACPPRFYYNQFDADCQDCSLFGNRAVSRGGDQVECTFCEAGTVAIANGTACGKVAKLT